MSFILLQKNSISIDQGKKPVLHTPFIAQPYQEPISSSKYTTPLKYHQTHNITLVQTSKYHILLNIIIA